MTAISLATVLLIAPTESDRARYRQFLHHEKTVTYTIVEADCAATGLILYRQHQPLAIVVHYPLADATGLDVLQQLAQQGGPNPCAVILLGDDPDGDLATQARAQGAQDYLSTANLTTDLLCRAVRYAIQQSQLQQQLGAYQAQVQSLTSQLATVQAKDGQTRDNPYCRLADQAGDMLSQFSIAGIFLYVSPACQGLLGYAPTVLLGRSVYDLVHPADQAIVAETFDRAVQTQTSEKITYRMRKPDQDYRWFESDICAMVDLENHLPPQLIAISRDITTRKDTELVLQRQYDQVQLFATIALKIRRSLKLDDILQTAVTEVFKLLVTDRVVIFQIEADGSGKIVQEAVSHAELTLMGQTIEDKCFQDGRYIKDHPQGRLSVVADIQHSSMDPCYINFLRQLSVQANLVVPIVHSDRLWGLVVAHECYQPRQWLAWEVDLLTQLADQIGIALDQSNLLSALQKSQTRLMEAQRIGHIGSWDYDLKRRTMVWSAQLYRLFKWDATLPPPDYAQMSQLFHPDDVAILEDATQQTMATLQPYRLVLQAVLPGGTRRFVEAIGNVDCGADEQEIYRLYGTMQDITDRIQTQQELQQLNTRLKESNQELQHFAFIASHDLKEPLRTVRSFSSILKNHCADQIDDTAKDYLQRIQKAAGRMQSQIDDLLRLSRVTTQASPFVPVSLAKVADQVLSSLNAIIQQTGATIQIVGELPTIMADTSQMQQLLQNLISNGIKFHGQAAPVITIDSHLVEPTKTSPAVCQLSIRDNGIGFDEKYTDRIFQIFERLHNQDCYEGTGMGLAICRKITERHGGSITAKSSLGGGTTFSVILPLHHPDNDDSDMLVGKNKDYEQSSYPVSR